MVQRLVFAGMASGIAWRLADAACCHMHVMAVPHGGKSESVISFSAPASLKPPSAIKLSATDRPYDLLSNLTGQHAPERAPRYFFFKQVPHNLIMDRPRKHETFTQNAVSLLGQRRRRWANIETVSGEYLVLTSVNLPKH